MEEPLDNFDRIAQATQNALDTYNKELRQIVRQMPREQIKAVILHLPPEVRTYVYNESIKTEDFEICEAFRELGEIEDKPQ